MKSTHLLLLLIVLIIGCQRTDETIEDGTPKLGIISMEITGNEQSKELFHEGLLLLHNFAYADAIEKFSAAQEADSTCAMAYWGEIMAQNKPLWREQQQDEANFIFSKLGKTPEEQLAHFKTPLEQDLCKGAQTLYEFGPEKAERDQAYATYMESLFKKYPEQHEVAALYALSLLGSKAGKRNEDDYMKSAKIAQSIINENPQHPGALHYLIHSYDDPDNAPKALFAANNYSKVAADAAHALHMPSHIFIAMGMWDEVISSNIASFEASKKRKIEKDLSNNALGYHAFKWLNYGYLQKKNYPASRKLVEQMQQYANEEATKKSLGHLIYMKAAYVMESNDWDLELIFDTLDYSDLPVQMTAAHFLLLGNVALREKNTGEFEKIKAKLNDAIKEAKKEVAVGSPPMCSGSYGRDRPTQIHIDRATVMLLNLEATDEIKKSNYKVAEEKLLQAIELEDNTSYMYGPPEVIIPSREHYADFLIKQSRGDEAVAQFKKVLERAPKRFISQKRLDNRKKAL